MIKKVCAFALSIFFFFFFSLPSYAESKQLDSSYPFKAVESKAPNPTRTVKFLSPKISKSLKLTRIPTEQPVPIIVGTYWDCTTQSGFEICDFVLVVCTNDQETCVQVN